MRPLALEAGAAFVKVLPPAAAPGRLWLCVSTKEESVALDNYTRRQKIMITALIVVIAAMFTVTGSLTYMLGDSAKTPSKAGEMDGREYNYVEFHQRIRQGLNACTFLDYGQGQGDLKPRAIYPRVPALTTQPQDAAETPYERSLLDVWPRYQDNYVWCHLALVKRAEKAGVQRPSNQAVWSAVHALMNASAQEFDKFPIEKLYAQFQDRYGYELSSIESTLRDCLMVRSYVDSLVAGERARLADIARIAAGNNDEVKAEYLRLPVAPFLEKARAEVEREHHNARAARVANGSSLASAPAGADPCSEMYEKHRFNELNEEARFEFEIIKAEYRDLEQLVPRNEKLERLYYESMKKAGEFKADDADKKNLDARVEAEFNAIATDKRAKDAAWPGFKPEEEKALRDQLKKDLAETRSFFEVQGDIYTALRRDKAPLLAQALISTLKARLDDVREKNEKRLNATSALSEQRQRNVDTLRNQRNDLRVRFDSIVNVINGQFANVAARIPTPTGAASSDADKKAWDIKFANLIEDLVRFLDEDIAREQLSTLNSTAQRTMQDLDRTLRDKEARLEEQRSQKEIKGPDGEPLDEVQRKLEIDRLEMEIAGLKEQVALRDLLFEGKGGKQEDSVRTFVDGFKKVLVGYKLSLRGLLLGDIDARRFAFDELLVEIPTALGNKLREARDRIVSQQSVDDLDAQAALMRADLDAFRSRIKREASDTRRDLSLEKVIGDANLDVTGEAGKGLKLPAGFGSVRLLTWRDVVTDAELRWLEYVDGAKRFLEEPSYTEGSVSDVMGYPDRGLYLLRLIRKTPKYTKGEAEVTERLLTLAAQQRARQFCIQELKLIRADIIKRGWDAAVADAKKRWPMIEVLKTDWISAKVDIPDVQSESDSELLAFSSGPSTSDPDKPFMDRLKDIKPEDGVSEIVPEKFNKDPLKKPEEERWNYLLARVIDRRTVARRLSESDLEDSSFGRGPADIATERRLASSAIVMELITPKRLLEGVEIYRYPSTREQEDEKDNSAGK
jgi:hypothetical protein